MSNDAKLERRTQPPDQRAAAAAVDDKSCQDNEKYNCSGDRPPVIFAAPWVGPPAVVARPTSAFKISMYHR